MPTEKMCTVIETIAENRRRYEEFCYALSEEQLNRPVPESTWIVRDFAAHLGTLDVALIGWFGAAATGGQTDSSRIDGKAFDVDAFNDAEVASRRAWPLQDVFAEAAKNRVGLVRVLESLTDEQIDRSMHFAGDSKRPGADFPLKLFLAGWAQHDPIHVADMLRGLPELAENAEIASWLANPFVRGYQASMNSPASAT